VVVLDLRRLTETFVDLADTLVDEFDVIELLHVLTGRCVDLLGVDAAGVMLADRRGQLRLAAASSEQARLLELIELQNDEGPCLDSFRTGRAVSYVDDGTAPAPWPLFASRSKAEGFSSVHALPLRLRQEIIGALNLFGERPQQLPAEDVRVAQAFSDDRTYARSCGESRRGVDKRAERAQSEDGAGSQIRPLERCASGGLGSTVEWPEGRP
jgi:transcriptional regulator with GAF, ATPase, and Fis domain